MHLTTIFILSYLWTLIYSLLGRHNFCFLIYANNFWDCTQIWVYTKYKMLRKCYMRATNILICKPYLLLHNYELFNYSSFGTHFFTVMKVLLQFINILHLAAIFVLSHQLQLIYSLFGRHTSFSLFKQIFFESIHRYICTYTQNKSSLIP